MNNTIEDDKREKIVGQNDDKIETDEDKSTIPYIAINRDYTYIW